MVYFVSVTGDDANSGRIDAPFKTPELAVKRLRPGDSLYLRGGEYRLREALVISERADASSPIVLSGYPHETVVLDAGGVNFNQQPEQYPFKHETGAVFVYGASHVTVRQLTVVNTHGHGIAVRDADHVSVDSCTTQNSFSCGISLWDTASTGTRCAHNKIISNTVINANTWDMLPQGMARGHEPPHEAVSVAGACYFEVAFNHVYQCGKEGIDVKENACHGEVHHNHIHHVNRQGLYADAWFGPLGYVSFYENSVHHCKGAGLVISVEQGHCAHNITVYRNHLYDNDGSGLLFGVWGADGPRQHIRLCNNLIERNGHGTPEEGFDYYWITGGLCMLSANIRHCAVCDNIFADNKGFDIGYSQAYLADGRPIEEIFTAKRITFCGNVIATGGAPPAYPLNTNDEKGVLYGYTPR